jgi:hypothetical protein
MEKIEVLSTAQCAEAGKVSRSQYLRLTKRAIAAAALAAGLLVQTQGFAQVPISTGTNANTVSDAPTTSDPEKAARRTWRAVIKNTPAPGEGCFRVSYPDVAWEPLDCKVAQPRVHHAPRRPTNGEPATVGNGNDYVAQSQGLINTAIGSFSISGVTSETNVGVALFGGGGILGTNEYSLQINTNNNGQTNVCNGHPYCRVWQQFMYATDYNQKGEGALFIQYWLLDWNATCPHGWRESDTDCFMNSKYLALPDLPVTDLDDVVLVGTAFTGSGDCIALEYGNPPNEIWQFCTPTSVLDIYSVWNQAEFNVVGDMEGSQAQFNQGSQITVILGIDGINAGSPSAPACVAQIATTGETNNLTLGNCYTGVAPQLLWGCNLKDACGGFIEFTESLPPYRTLPPIGPGPCLTCINE